MRIKIIKTGEPAFKALLARILQRGGSREGKVEKRVAVILARCKERETEPLSITPNFLITFV